MGDSNPSLMLETPEPGGWKALPRGARIGIVSVSVLLGLLLITWLALPSIVGWLIRRELPKAEEKLGRKVDFGDLELHGLSGVTLRDVVVYDKAGSEPFLRVDSVDVRLSSVPLWGDFTVASITVEGPSAHLVRANGEDNFSDIVKALTKKKPKTQKKKSSGSKKKKSLFDPFPTVTVRGAALRFTGFGGTDKASGITSSLDSISGFNVTLTATDTPKLLDVTSHFQLGFHFDDHPTRVEPIAISGDIHTGKLEESRLALAFPEGLQLPIAEQDAPFVGLRLQRLDVGLDPPQPVNPGEEPPSALQRAYLQLGYGLGPMTWSTRERLAGLAWLDRLVTWPIADTTVASLPAPDPNHLATLNERSVQAYIRGQTGPVTTGDIAVMMSAGEAYNQKWDFRAMTDDGWNLRFQFTVANLGLGDFKGLVNGRLYRREGGETVDSLKFREKLSKREWNAAESGFDVRMGDFRMWGIPGDFHVEGVAKDARFTFHFTGAGWKPGTGVVLFGKEEAYYKNTILTAAGQARGVVERGDVRQEVGPTLAYVDHIATNVEAHNMMDRTYYFRKHDGPWYVEWRRVVTTQSFYDGQDFGYLVVAKDGEIVFSSTELTIEEDNLFTDTENLGYVMPQSVTVRGQDGERQATLTLTQGGDRDIKITNVLAKLPALERTVAEQFAKPFAYSVYGPWVLSLDGVEAYRGDGSFSATVLR